MKIFSNNGDKTIYVGGDANNGLALRPGEQLEIQDAFGAKLNFHVSPEHAMLDVLYKLGLTSKVHTSDVRVMELR